MQKSIKFIEIQIVSIVNVTDVRIYSPFPKTNSSIKVEKRATCVELVSKNTQAAPVAQSDCSSNNSNNNNKSAPKRRLLCVNFVMRLHIITRTRSRYTLNMSRPTGLSASSNVRQLKRKKKKFVHEETKHSNIYNYEAQCFHSRYNEDCNKSGAKRKIISKKFFSLNATTNLTFIFVFILFFTSKYVVNLSHQQSLISLNTAQWFVSNANNSIFIPAQVPGGIYSDLRRNSILKQDILFGKNDVAYRWVGNENWTYATTFTIDHQLARSQSVKLVLHGVDTIASVLLNGQEIGTTDNMFVRYKFDIKPHLKLAGMPNFLAIRFESPVKYSNRRSHQSIRQNRGKIIPPYCPSPAQRGECHVNFIRKMQASFSWDWGPAFPSMGIYKDIEIEFGSFGIIRDILVETRRLQATFSQATANRRQTTSAPPPLIISSSIRQQVRKPMPSSNKTVPYIRAPPYYVSSSAFNQEHQESLLDHGSSSSATVNIDLTDDSTSNQQLFEDNWLLKTTLVAEMVQPSFGYNVRIEFNLNGVLHYESEHINVVANQEGTIRLGFNLRIDQSRMRVKPWWPNNAGSQTLYKLTARMMPIPNPSPTPSSSDRVGRRFATAFNPSLEAAFIARRRFTRWPVAPPDDNYSLQFRSKPLQTPAIPANMVFLATHQHEHPGSSLYQLQHVSEKQVSFGFRTVELIQEPISPTNGTDNGLTFQFRINGVDLFAMGSNWIPSSVLPEQSNDVEYVRYLLQSAKDANMNMLRVWGGGIYESDAFYRIADELGIMIWHDFMFACALYPSDDDFLASVRLEIEQQVQRLQHHPSIVLWAGNNENEMAIAGPWWPEVMAWNKKLRENYATLYVETIKPIVQILDPTRPYVESSPSNGIMSQTQQYSIARTPNDNKYGDVHHYDYLADSFDWTNYPSTRFASEYGFQSYPSFSSLALVSTQNDWKYPLTSNILHRQHRLTGESEIRLQIKLHFNEPQSGGIEKFKTFIYTSQLTQAIAIKTETEFYRRNRFIDPETKLGKTMGALYWQLNDVWQAPTWSSIEYGGKWKMLHYFARRFFFPIQVIPYLIQPSGSNNLLQTLLNGAGSSSSSSSNAFNLLNSFSSTQNFSRQHLSGNNMQYEPPINPTFAIDLVRDDLFYLLDSFNVTMKFFRWTSFSPIWQETIYVKNTRPQNVTRIYEQDLARILRNQPGGGISPSSGVFQVVIEQQPSLGLSEIDNYLLPLMAPSKITAMRVAKIGVEMVQGPFQLTDLPRGMDQQKQESASLQWACVYRLTLVSDSIAMFVWLDLNVLSLASNSANAPPPPPPQSAVVDSQPPEHIRLNAMPPLPAAQTQSASSINTDSMSDFPNVAAPAPPEHIRLHLNNQQRGHQMHEDISIATAANNDAAAAAAAAAVQAARQLRRNDEQPFGQSNSQLNMEQPSSRIQRIKLRAPYKQTDQVQTSTTSAGTLRFQFSDNAFNMFEPSKVIDLYLTRCLSKSQVELALEIQTLAENL